MYKNEYKTMVLAVFDYKKNNNDLKQELVSPTAGNLKAEAARVCAKRFDPKDETVLGSFFNAESGRDGYYRAIQNCDYQIFRPLSDFLNNRKRTTNFKNIQLLAWLIDFKPRPFNANLQMEDVIHYYPQEILPTETVDQDHSPKPIKDAENEKEIPAGTGRKTINGMNKVNKNEQRTFGAGFKWMMGAAALLIIGLICVIIGPDRCMYWSDDHYIASACGVPKADTPLIALDRTRLQGFRRIKHTDTLSRYSVGRLWWTSVGSHIEIYSAGGKHPLYPDKTLRKVTDYVVNICHNPGGVRMSIRETVK